MEVARHLLKLGHEIFCLLEDREKWIIYLEKLDRDSSFKYADLIEELGYNVTKVDICLPGLVCIHFEKGPPEDRYEFVSSGNTERDTGENKKILYGEISKLRVSYTIEK